MISNTIFQSNSFLPALTGVKIGNCPEHIVEYMLNHITAAPSFDNMNPREIFDLVDQEMKIYTACKELLECFPGFCKKLSKQHQQDYSSFCEKLSQRASDYWTRMSLFYPSSSNFPIATS